MDSTISTLRAFQSDRELELAFYKAFDSVDVLPLSLSAEYEQLLDEDPLKASELLVSIRWQQWAIQGSKGLTREDEVRGLREIDAHYDDQIGLDFTRTRRDEEDF